MAEIDIYRENIKENMENLQNLITRSPLFNNDPKKWRNQCNGLIKDINSNILLFEDEVKDLPAAQASQYVGSIKSFKKKLEKLENDAHKRQRGVSHIEELQSKTTIIQSQQEKRTNAINEVMKKGDDAQDRTKESLKEMNRMNEKGIQMAADINIELTKQIEQLDRMNDKVKDTESVLKKAQKNIVYFARAMECDKCMAGMLLLILLGLVTVIVLAIKKKDAPA